MDSNLDPKAGERAYYANLDDAGRDHARRKPFSDPDVAKYLADMAAVFSLIGSEPKRILDLGCGTGWTSIFLARAGHHVTGVDIAEDAIAIAREQARLEFGHLEFLVGDYEFPLPKGAFDFALFYDALHHAEDESAALRQAYEALSPNGILITIEPGDGHSHSKGSRHAIQTFGVHEKDMAPGHIWRIAKRVGFRRKLFLPTPRDASKNLFRRDFILHPKRLWIEKLWGYGRLVWKIHRAKTMGLTLLWK